jgi:predicted neutral ceramidase superfamily lipid hydrolase
MGFAQYRLTAHGQGFGPDGSLAQQYQLIGRELVRIEQSSFVRGIRSEPMVRNLRQALAFIAVEVLESYLEDLLDLEVSEEKLFINRPTLTVRTFAVCSMGVVLALIVGLFAARSGASLLLAFSLTVLLALPFAVIWHYVPKTTLMRRMLYAQALSQVIAQRRGGDGRSIQITERLGKLLGPRPMTRYPAEGATFKGGI